MNHFYIPAETLEDWRRLLVDPEKHWKDGYSAKCLATRWWEAKGFPAEITESFIKSEFPFFEQLQFVVGFPEHKEPLPGKGNPSQTDLMVLARSNAEFVVVAVEGKVDESFGSLVGEWLRKPSAGKIKRFAFLAERLGLAGQDLTSVRYQLLHRSVSALLTAEHFAARHAVVLIHSFSTTRTGFNYYSDFLRLFKLEAMVGTVQRAAILGGIELYFSWTVGPANKPVAMT